MPEPFEDFDLSDFWEDSAYAKKEYLDVPVTDALVAEVEAELGFKLPAAYVALMRNRNGGLPKRNCVPTSEPTSWSEDHAAITGISAIGRTARYSLLGQLGSRFMQREWGYPEFGVCIADCPSAGHDMIMLDYRECGPQGEPQVIHVDQESNFRVTFLAKDFEAFIRALVDEESFTHDEEILEAARITVQRGSFTPLLAELVADPARASYGPRLRQLAGEIVEAKGYFGLHAEEKSWLVYDILFHLYTSTKAVTTQAQYLKAYPQMLVRGNGFSTGAYAPELVKEWYAARKSAGDILKTKGGGLRFSDAAVARLEAALA